MYYEIVERESGEREPHEKTCQICGRLLNEGEEAFFILGGLWCVRCVNERALTVD